MPSKNALFQLAISRCPITIDKPEERIKWLDNALTGKTPEQVQQELDDPHFGLSPDFVYDYAAQHIAREKERGREVPGQNNPAVVDMFRQLAGDTPLFYDLNEKGMAAPKDYLTELHKIRAAHTQESGWRNFWNNTAYSVMEGTAGFTALGARAMDGIGVTEGASLYWQKQTEEMEQLLAPQGGVSGMAGQLVGNTMFSLLVGGAGKSTAMAVKGGGWRASMLQMAKEGAGVGMAFGLSEAGRRFGIVAELRAQGRDISLADELTYSVAGGAVEAATEAFGWGIARGFGRGLIKNLPGLRDVVGKEGVQGAVRWLTHLGANAIGQAVGSAPKGAIEEGMAQFGSNLIDKYMDVLPDELKPELTTGLKEAALMGALQPLVTGIPLGMISRTPHIKGSEQIFDDLQQRHGVDVIMQGQYPIVTTDGLTPEQIQELGIEQIPGPETGKPVTALPGYSVEAIVSPLKFLDYSFGERITELSDKEKTNLVATKIRTELKEKYSDKITPGKERVKPAYQKGKKGEGQPPRVGGIKKKWRALMRMDRRLEAISPQLHDAVYKPMIEGSRQALNNSQAVRRDFAQKFQSKRQMKQFMLTKQTFVGSETEQEFELTGSEKMGIVLLARQAEGRLHLVHGHGYSEQDLQNIENSLTEEEAQVFNYMSNYYAELEPRVRAEADRLGIKFDARDFYATMTVIDGQQEHYDYFTESLNEYTKAQIIPEHKFLEERKKGKYRQYDIDGISAFWNNVQRFERFIALTKPASEVSQIVNNQKLKDTLSQLRGREFNEEVSAWLEDTIKGHGKEIQGSVENTLEGLRRNVGVFMVGFKLMTTLGKQPLAIFRTMAYDGVTGAYCMKNLVTMTNPIGFRKAKKFIMANSKEMPIRNPERFYIEAANAQIADQKKRAKHTYRTLAEKPTLSDRAMNFPRWTDNAFAIISWMSLYEGHFHENQDHDTAVAHADKQITRTQSAARIEQLPEMFRGGLTDRILSQFQNEPNQNLNFWAHEVYGEWQRGNISTNKMAYRLFMSSIVPAFFMGVVTRGDMPDDFWEALNDIFSEGVGAVTGIGTIASALMQGYEPGTPLGETQEELTKSYNRSVKLAQYLIDDGAWDTDEDTKKLVTSYIKFLSMVKGLPTGQAIMTAESVVDWQEGEITEVQELLKAQVYSKWARQRDERERQAEERKQKGALTGF